MHIFEYTDYRTWLKDRTEELKILKPFFSYRYIALRLGINASLIARILNGQSHLTLKHVAPMGALLELSAVEMEYFDELVHFCRAKRSQDWEKHFLRMQCIRGQGYKTVADNQLEYYSSWQHNAMRTLLSIYDFKGTNYRKLGSMMIPPISAEEAEASVELLLSLGLVKKNKEGIFVAPDTFISTGENWKAAMIQNFQKEMLQHSQNSLDVVPKNLRDISSITIPLDRSLVRAIAERIREFRQEILLMAKECEVEDSVYQMNFQLFPLALMDFKKIEANNLSLQRESRSVQ